MKCNQCVNKDICKYSQDMYKLIENIANNKIFSIKYNDIDCKYFILNRNTKEKSDDAFHHEKHTNPTYCSDGSCDYHGLIYCQDGSWI